MPAPDETTDQVYVRIAEQVTMAELDGHTIRILGGEPRTLLTVKAAAFPPQARHNNQLPAAGHVITLPRATAEILFRRNLATPYPQPPRSWPDPTVLAHVAIVIPCHNDEHGLRAALAGLQPLIDVNVRIIIVDDGSTRPLHDTFHGYGRELTIIRNAAPRGPATARNQGIAVAEEDGRHIVALLDADTVPRRTEWLGLLIAHLNRDSVAMVAPRIIAAQPGHGGVQGFETARSALDMGHFPAFVRPRTSVPYVPSAALVLHLPRIRAALGDGPIFNEDMHVAEDVDLCWRLTSTGVEILYDPDARMAHRHRTQLGPLLARRMFYGQGAAQLARTHTAEIVPAIFSVRMLIAAAGIWWARPWSLLLAAAATAWSYAELAHKIGDNKLARQLTAASVNSAMWQLAAAALRPYAPLTLAAVSAASVLGVGTHLRHTVALAAVLEGLRHWIKQHPPERLPLNTPTSHLLLHRLDDLAYGIGVWRSAITARSLRALVPEIRW